MNNILQTQFYSRDTLIVAKDLIGKILVRNIEGTILSGIISETECYKYNDPACHAFKGMTPRTKALFGPVGHSYIYFIYGNYYCLNVVAKEKSSPYGGVLIRGIKPLDGIQLMQINRKTNDISKLTDGPGKLTQALKINKDFYGIDLTKKGSMYIIEGEKINYGYIISTPRIGINIATKKLWRFILK